MLLNRNFNGKRKGERVKEEKCKRAGKETDNREKEGGKTQDRYWYDGIFRIPLNAENFEGKNDFLTNP
jgi:hypothetical protein